MCIRDRFSAWAQEAAARHPRLTLDVLDDGTDSNENRLGAVGDMRFVLEHRSVDDDLLVAASDNFFTDVYKRQTMDIDGNPNGSVCAIEGITSPDGRVFGRMAHAERTGAQLYRNVPGNQDSGIVRGAVDYFRD